MADENVDIAIRVRNGAQAARELRNAEQGIQGIDREARSATVSASRMGSAVSVAAGAAGRGFDFMARQAKYASIGIAGVAAAGVKWGLGFNAQVESARLRFGLFTSDVDGLMRSVQKLDSESGFGLAELADAAAMLGNAEVKDVPRTLRAAANAAAASGKGVNSLNSIVIALSQIQSKGRLSQEEINQLNEAGAPGAQRTIQRAFNLTSKQIANLGANGIDATEALRVLTQEWTSGKMADAAERQTRTLGGQWSMFTGNTRKLSGALTDDLAASLRDDVLPAANKVAEEMTRIFSDDNLTSEQKIRKAVDSIRKGLGPIADLIGVEIGQADIPKALGDALDKAGPVLVDAGKEAAGFFVDAWLDAPVWAQVLSAAWLGKKLFGGAGASLGKGIGQGIGAGVGRGIAEKVATELSGSLAGRLAEGFLGRGGTPANPLFVLDVGGGAPGKGPGRGMSKTTKAATAATAPRVG